MSFEVRFTSEAEKNVREIFNWIAESSPDGALRWVDALETAKSRLQDSGDDCGLEVKGTQLFLCFLLGTIKKGIKKRAASPFYLY